ncbi:MAG: toxin-antitoxin system, antitoxin component [Deltaproteobacteria bacterium]|nr:toxin-antitoxin system, antitoxin component [Deltaproteobacteria bacterium]
MPTQLPRINVTLERPLLTVVQRLAHRDDVSVSMKVRDLIRDAIELTEDDYWQRKATRRRATFNRRTALTHDEIWK